MELPIKMQEMLDDEGADLMNLLTAAYSQVEGLGVKFHCQNSPNVIARHPSNQVNCVTLWLKGRKGDRRIEAEIRVDGYPVDVLSTDMRDDCTLRKYDRGKKPLWFVLTISNSQDIKKLCQIAKRVISKTPDWRSA